MKEVSLLAIDLAKRVFQLHGCDKRGNAVLKKRLKREQLVPFMANFPKCIVAMEACGGAHHWGRTFQEMGHTVKLHLASIRKTICKIQ